MITKRDFILCGSCLYEEYSIMTDTKRNALVLRELMLRSLSLPVIILTSSVFWKIASYKHLNVKNRFVALTYLSAKSK